MNILGIIGNLFGIGKDFLENKAKLKHLKQIQEHEIIKAETSALVNRINSNTESDNEIDLVTARDKKYTYKDELVTYIFLMPVIIATLVPFLTGLKKGNWDKMNIYVKESYQCLDLLPQWYHWVLAAVVIDVLGFRSFARALVKKYIKK